jgi:hypothetical protein
MRWAVLIGVLALAGCEKGSAKAEKQAEIVDRTGDKAASCDAKRKVADAYLNEGDEAKYRDWKLAADAACMAAKYS